MPPGKKRRGSVRSSGSGSGSGSPLLPAAAAGLLVAVVAALLLLLRRGATDEDPTARIIAWLLSGGDSSAAGDQTPVLHVGIASFPIEGRGLGTTGPVKRGELLSWIPAKYAISLETSALPPAAKAALSSAGAELVAEAGGVGGDVLLTAALLLYEEALGAASFFEPYVRSLPRSPPTNMATWSRSEFRLLITFVGKHDGLACATSLPRLLAALAPHVQGRVSAQTVAQWAAGADAPPTRMLENSLEEHVQWACSMSLSRDFRGSLYPIADMANHDAQGEWGKDSLGFSFSSDCIGPMMVRAPSTLSAAPAC